MTCTRTQEFLERNEVETAALADAKKSPMGRSDALALARQADEIYATKGKKVVHLNLQSDKPTDDEIADLMLGPTGNLRAPTAKRGRALLVGFDEETYLKVLKMATSTSR
jgi:arsenate reductase-like glutaredoxin family protein